jgi:hypothetical protein
MLNPRSAFALLALSLSASVAQAGPSTAVIGKLGCSTGDSLSGVTVEFTEDGLARLEIAKADDSSDKFMLLADANDWERIRHGRTVTAEGKKPDSIEFGGSVSPAILFEIKLGASTLAYGGKVYRLDCVKE